MALFSEMMGEISVCEDCLHIHANGEYPGDPDDRPANAPEAWSLIGFGYDVTMGGEHSDMCTEADRAEGCECDQLGFSWLSCDGCGSKLGGDRFQFTVWRTPLDEARRQHARALMSESLEWWERLDLAAQWRTYIGNILAADRRFALSMARMKADRLAA